MIRGAFLDCLGRQFGVVVAGHQNNADLGIELQNLFQQLRSLHARHHQVRKHDPRPQAMDQLQSGPRIGGLWISRPVLARIKFQKLQVFRIVVDGH